MRSFVLEPLVAANWTTLNAYF